MLIAGPREYRSDWPARPDNDELFVFGKEAATGRVHLLYFDPRDGQAGWYHLDGREYYKGGHPDLYSVMTDEEAAATAEMMRIWTYADRVSSLAESAAYR